MAGLVGAHALSSFSDPQNGQTPIDADQVRANDDDLAAGLTAHDADATIHIQSSALGSRPAAGTAGRIWLTSDGLRLYYDTGSAWSEVDYLNKATGGTVTGAVTLGNTLTFSAAASRIIPGATSFAIRNNANNVDRLIIRDSDGQVALQGEFVTRAGTSHSAPAISLGASGATFWATTNEGRAGANAVESFAWDDEATNDQSRFLLYDQQEAAFYRVKFGADNSGPSGSGRALYIDNGS